MGDLMAMEPLYFGIITALVVFAVLQQIDNLKWRRAAAEYRRRASAWKRLAGDYGHHQIGRDRINRNTLPERTEDQ
jgi:hypothetical protein